MRTRLLLVVILLVHTAGAAAHVTVWPRESSPGIGERYTVRVPTEGQVATTSIELEVPPGVTVTGVLVQSGPYELKREGGRIVGITWTMEIKPGEFGEFVFLARNPKDASQIGWKVRQRYADGTSAEWFGPAGDRRPASVTRLIAASPKPAAGR